MHDIASRNRGEEEILSMPRAQDGPRAFGKLRHSGNAGIGFGYSDPWNFNADAEAERQHTETIRKNASDYDRVQRDRRTQVKKFEREFRNDKACHEHLAKVRWPTGVSCPHCASAATLKRVITWRCNICEFEFTACTGTSVEPSRWRLWFWYRAAFLILWNRREHQIELSAERFSARMTPFVDDPETLRLRVVALLDECLEIHTGNRDRDLRNRIAVALLGRRLTDGK